MKRVFSTINQSSNYHSLLFEITHEKKNELPQNGSGFANDPSGEHKKINRLQHQKSQQFSQTQL